MAQPAQILYPQMSGKGPFTVEASGYQEVEGETIPRTHPAAKDKLITTPSDDVKTVFDIIKRSAAKFGNAKALGTRKVIKTHEEVKMVKKTVDGQTKEVEKKWTYFELSGYSYISFIEYEKMILQIGSGLRKLGMVKGDRVHLFASTRYWIPRAPFLSFEQVADHWWFIVYIGSPCLMVRFRSPCPWPQHTTLWARTA